MTPSEIAIATVGLVVAGLVKGVTGVGYSTTALPIIAIGIGFDHAMALVLLPSISSNLLVMRTAGEFRQTAHRFRPLFFSLLPGLFAGLATLAWIDTHLAARVLGVVIIAYALYGLTRPALHLPQGSERWLNLPVGLLNGFINGLTGSQIMPVVPYALSLGLSTDAVIQLTNITFTISSLVMMVGLARVGYIAASTLLVSALGIAPALLAAAVGARLRNRLSPVEFRKAVLLFLIVLASMLIAGA